MRLLSVHFIVPVLLTGCVARVGFEPLRDPADTDRRGDEVRSGGNVVCNELSGGVHVGTEDTIGGVRLQPGLSDGYYISDPCDAGATTVWQSLTLVPRAPYCKEFPKVGESEPDYNADGIDNGSAIAIYLLNGAADGAVSTGANIIDASGLAAHGVAQNTNGTGMQFRPSDLGLGRSLYLNDGDDYVSLSASLGLLRARGAISVSCWMRMETQGSWQTMLDFATGVSSNSRLEFFVNPTGRVGIVGRSSDSESAVRQDMTAGGLTIGQWQHVVGSMDITGDNVRIFVDGQSVTTSGTMNFSEPLTSDTDSLDAHMGEDVDGNENLRGDLDEVVVWNADLDEADAARLYRRGVRCSRYRVRTCADATCAGEDFRGPDGTVQTAYAELRGIANGLPLVIDLSGLPPGRFLQYTILFDSDGSVAPPEILSASISTP